MKKRPTQSTKRKNNNSIKKATAQPKVTTPPLVQPPSDETNKQEEEQVTLEEVPTNNVEQDEEEKQQIKEAIERDREVVQWMKAQVEAETKRLKKNGAKVSVMNVKNTGIVREDEENAGVAKNRIEVNTNTDFDRVQQLLLSDPIPCPSRENHDYVNVRSNSFLITNLIGHFDHWWCNCFYITLHLSQRDNKRSIKVDLYQQFIQKNRIQYWCFYYH
jgi:hypothetical protein